MTTPVKKIAAKAEEKAAVKTPEVKAVEPKAVETAPVAIKTPEEKAPKRAARKAGPKAAAKKEAAPKAEKDASPKAEKDAATKTVVHVEYRGRQVTEEEIIAAVKRAWVGAGKKAAELKTMELYIKPEDGAVYYVINGDSNGQVAF